MDAKLLKEPCMPILFQNCESLFAEIVVIYIPATVQAFEMVFNIDFSLSMTAVLEYCWSYSMT